MIIIILESHLVIRLLTEIDSHDLWGKRSSAALAEGDGAIIADSNGRRIRFIITQKEDTVLYLIQQKLGFGTVRFFPQGKNKNGYYRYTVEDFKSLMLLAKIFNGNLAIKHRILQLEK